MTELYYINKFFKDFNDKKYINYEDEILNNIFKNYDVNKHKKENDIKFYTLLTQKLSRELAKYFNAYINMINESENTFNFKTREEIINNAIEHCRLIQNVLMEDEEEIFYKIVLLSKKYQFKIPLVKTAENFTNEKLKYAIDV